jgi:hypothetical protein
MEGGLVDLKYTGLDLSPRRAMMVMRVHQGHSYKIVNLAHHEKIKGA